jgi:predicted ATPase
MKRIAIFGTHGAAKTTLVYKLAAYFKGQDKNVTVIHETARQCPFPINQTVVFQTTLYVVASQLKKELDAEAQGFEIAISDRTLSDAFIYINFFERDNALTQSLEQFCIEWMKQYDVLIYLEPSEGFIPTEDGKRATDLNFQKAIRDDFRIMINDIEKKIGKKLPLIRAESSQIFDEKECLKLMKQTHKEIYEHTRNVVMA